MNGWIENMINLMNQEEIFNNEKEEGRLKIKKNKLIIPNQ
jgi:hypothetical protein